MIRGIGVHCAFDLVQAPY